MRVESQRRTLSFPALNAHRSPRNVPHTPPRNRTSSDGFENRHATGTPAGRKKEERRERGEESQQSRTLSMAGTHLSSLVSPLSFRVFEGNRTPTFGFTNRRAATTTLRTPCLLGPSTRHQLMGLSSGRGDSHHMEVKTTADRLRPRDRSASILASPFHHPRAEGAGVEPARHYACSTGFQPVPVAHRVVLPNEVFSRQFSVKRSLLTEN